jgi:hypothetical protein
MPGYKVSIDPDALQDIQDATDWYNEQLAGLGGHFQKQVKIQIGSLKKNALGHSVRYEDVRCMLIKRFPFLVHYRVIKGRDRSQGGRLRLKCLNKAWQQKVNQLFITSRGSLFHSRDTAIPLPSP